jgi:hypothetical protein
MLHDDELTLHERIKVAEKLVRRATDDLEADRFAYRDDPTDKNRLRIMKANSALNEAITERDELVDQVVGEDWY